MLSISKMNYEDAQKLLDLIAFMTGGEQYLNRRAQLKARVSALFPELEEKDLAPTFDRKAIRELTVDEYEKRAIGEGLRSIIKDPRANGADFDRCDQAARVVMISKWFLDVTSRGKLEPFDGQSDDELDMGDDIAREAPIAPQPVVTKSEPEEREAR